MFCDFTGKIDNLLPPDLIDGVLTRMVLVNALYFKGLWKSRFRPENTKKRPFVAADGKAYQVPMLAQLSLFRSGKSTRAGPRSAGSAAAEQPVGAFTAFKSNLPSVLLFERAREGRAGIKKK